MRNLGRALLVSVAVATTAGLALTGLGHAQVPAASPAAVPAGAVLSPTQVAFLQAEVGKARRHFARAAAAIAGVSAEKVLPMLPSDWRAGDPRYAIIPALEKARRAPLSDEQRQKINEADRQMKAAIAKARLEAAKR